MADGHVLIDTKLDETGLKKGLISLGKKGLKLAATGIAAASAAVGGFALSSVKAGQDFDASMSQVAATMGTTVNQIGELRDIAKLMGSTTKFTATESADALNYLALAGYDVEKQIQALPTVLNLAAAGNMDLAYASDLVTDSMSALGLDMSELTGYADKMAKTASKSNTSVSQLGEAVLVCGGQAKLANMSVVDMNTALGILADNGIKGSEGGTALRNVLKNLYTPTSKSSKAMKELGVETANADGTLRDAQDVLQDLSAALDGLTEEQRIKAMGEIFDTRTIAGANALLKSSGQRWNELSSEISDCAGAAQKMADTQLDNLTGDVTILKSAWEGLQVELSDVMNGTLRDIVQFATTQIDRLHNALIKDGLEGLVSEAGNILGEAVAKVVDYAPKLVKLGVSLLKSFVEGIVKNKGQVLQAAQEIVKILYEGLMTLLPKQFQSPVKEAVKAITSAFKSVDLKKAFTDVANIAAKLIKVLLSIVKTVAPPLIKTLGFVSKNLDSIVPILLALIAAKKAYTIVTNLQTTATTIATTAQKLLNAAMSANPVGLVVAGITALIGVLTASSLLIEQQTSQYQQEREAAEEYSATIRDQAQAYDDLKRSQAEQAAGDLAQIENTKNLWKELSTLADESGKVKDKDKARADFILGQLNDALGTEYTMTGDVIDNYKQMQTEIDNLIKKKKYEILANAAMPAYEEAITNAINYRMEAAEAASQKAEAHRQVELKLMEVMAKQQEIQELQKNNAWDIAGAYEEDLRVLKSELDDLKGKENGYADAAVNASNIAKNALNDKIAYEESAALAEQGYLDQAIDGLSFYTSATNTALSGLQAGTAEATRVAKEEYANAEGALKTYLENVKNGTEEFDEGTLRMLASNVKGVYDKASELGVNVGDGFIDGMDGSQTSLNQETETVCQGVVDAAKAALGINSPSKVFYEIGEFTDEGLADGIDASAPKVRESGVSLSKVLVSAFDTLRHQMYNIGVNSINGIISGLADGTPRLLAKARGIANEMSSVMKKALEIHSPSRIMRKEIGRNTIKGVALGIEDEEAGLLNRLQSLGARMSESIDMTGYAQRMRRAIGADVNRIAYGMTSGDTYNQQTHNTYSQQLNFYTPTPTPYEVANAARKALEVH